MSFLRPEARAGLLRWRETLAGVATVALGLWFVLTSYGVVFGLGVVLILAGAAIAVAGVQRARFRQSTDGPGIVQIVEGRVTYFGPWSGGGASLDRLAWLELVPMHGGAGAWVLIEEEGERLEIPVDARGAERLFDVFAALPGLDTRAMLAALRPPVQERTQIWQRDRPRLH
jgi:hypothetical protein